MKVCRRGRLEVIGSQRRSIVGERHGASLTTRNPTERLGERDKIGHQPDSTVGKLLPQSVMFACRGQLNRDIFPPFIFA